MWPEGRHGEEQQQRTLEPHLGKAQEPGVGGWLGCEERGRALERHRNWQRVASPWHVLCCSTFLLRPHSPCYLDGALAGVL